MACQTLFRSLALNVNFDVLICIKKNAYFKIEKSPEQIILLGHGVACVSCEQYSKNADVVWGAHAITVYHKIKSRNMYKIRVNILNKRT